MQEMKQSFCYDIVGDEMVDEIRTVTYDKKLQVEAYRFKGVMQKFPNHFHDYYVIGYIEKGKRHLVCNQQEHWLKDGDVTFFNPQEPHSCEQVDGKTMDYRSINIKPDVMQQVVQDIFGEKRLPRFTPTVLYHSELTVSIKELHMMICDEQVDFKKEELFFILMEQLIREYSDFNAIEEPHGQHQLVEKICNYLSEHFDRAISLDELSDVAGISKYHLLRTFTRQKGITPYSYLETIRINKAKVMLENGASPLEVTFQTGFSDQSHFTNYFKKLIGLTPKQYMKIFVDEATSKK
ncbi:MAG: AraC family ligand binding domain-containing protein [Anaerolineaceae bacterium]|nr:AraC family ligand binding domain-containing protein [Anaerolineaceae bacterium]